MLLRYPATPGLLFSSLTVSLSLTIIVRMASMACLPVPRQQMTKSSAKLTIRAWSRCSRPNVFHPSRKRRMYRLLSSGEIAPATK